jgi:hypothetical protein
VDDFAREKHGALRESLSRLVRVVDGAIDSIAEAELPREMHGQPPRAVDELLGFDSLDDRAVVILGQHASDGILQVETFSEDQ